MNNDTTTIKVRKTTAEKLKQISSIRGRRESMEQVILELIEKHFDMLDNWSQK